MDTCVICNKSVRPRQEGLQCDRCQRWQHRTCNSGIDRDTYRRVASIYRNYNGIYSFDFVSSIFCFPEVKLSLFYREVKMYSKSTVVSSPGRDSRDSRSSRLVEATQKALGTNALCTGSCIFIWFLPHIYPIFTKSFF